VEKGEESKAFSNEQCFSMDVANNIIFEWLFFFHELCLDFSSLIYFIPTVFSG
jgi:hypothetical protein